MPSIGHLYIPLRAFRSSAPTTPFPRLVNTFLGIGGSTVVWPGSTSYQRSPEGNAAGTRLCNLDIKNQGVYVCGKGLSFHAQVQLVVLYAVGLLYELSPISKTQGSVAFEAILV